MESLDQLITSPGQVRPELSHCAHCGKNMRTRGKLIEFCAICRKEVQTPEVGYLGSPEVLGGSSGFREAMPRLEPFSTQVYVMMESPKAILVRNLNPKLTFEKTWVPLSQVHEDSGVRSKGERGELVVSGWFAKKAGWRA